MLRKLKKKEVARENEKVGMEVRQGTLNVKMDVVKRVGVTEKNARDRVEADESLWWLCKTRLTGNHYTMISKFCFSI